MSVKHQSLVAPLIPFPEKIVGTQARIVVFIKDPKTCEAVKHVIENGDQDDTNVFLATPNTNDKGSLTNTAADYYPIGVLARVEQFAAVGDGSYKFVATARQAAHLDEVIHSEEGGFTRAKIRTITLEATPAETKYGIELIDKLVRELATFSTIWETAYENKNDGSEQSKRLFSDPIYAADFICGQLEINAYQRIGYFLKETLTERITYLSEIVLAMLEKKQLAERINKSVAEAMEKNQRAYVLNEQMKAIRKEMRKLNGQDTSDSDDDEPLDELEVQLDAMKKELPEKVYKLCKREYSRYKLMQESTSEASVVRTYIETLLSVPWSKSEETQTSLDVAQEVLDEDHYGLEKVKRKVLEYLVTRDSKHPKILCLVGAPGVGKTSLCRSIAKAMGRKYCRMALGGVGDEAEIRGHRRTYVGAMPGQIIKHLIKAQVNNPVFVLDEIDKMSTVGHKGDPASAMLEVLDPEQNNTFEDNYLDTPFDLSKVFFICTANSLNLPAALLDRMEIISLEGYSEDEKLNIAKRHIIPHIKADLKLPENACAMTEDALRSIVRYYTRESGVRELERLLLTFIRKVLLKRELDKNDAWRNRDKSEDKDIKALEKYWSQVFDAKDVEEILGARRYTITVSQREPEVGLVNGLSWSETGGDILQIEALRFDGTGKTQRTGLLGDCMKESVEAALSVVRAHLPSLGVTSEKFSKSDWHIHFPEGAIKKDGPSAGISIVTALSSAITGIPVRSDVAMTGEICLRGDVLPIGGLKEKLLAALRGGVKTVLVPQENEKDVKEIDPKALQGLEVRSVKRIEEVVKFALTAIPTPSEGAKSFAQAADPVVIVKATPVIDCDK